MSTSTPNLGLHKPDPIEVVNVETDLNDNYDIIDEAIQDLRVPPKGKLWKTDAFQGPLSSEATEITFSGSRVVGGMSLGANGDGLVVPVSGKYNVKILGYATGSNTYRANFIPYRVRAATSNKDLMFLGIWKENDLDYSSGMEDEIPLQAGDEIRVKAGSSNNAGFTWGDAETTGIRLLVEYRGPLSGATPV